MTKCKCKNGKAKAWEAQPPNTPYDCAGAQIGRVVPGRKGGTITACATPAPEHPREGQYWIGLKEAGLGHPIRKRIVSSRLAALRRPKYRTPRELVAAAATYNNQPFALPSPTGDERPHDPAKHPCSPGAPQWGREYQDAVARAIEAGTERAALAGETPVITEETDDVPFNNPASASEYDPYIYDEFMTEPQAKDWQTQALACSDAYEKRARARSATLTKSEKRAAKQRRATAKRTSEKRERAERKKYTKTKNPVKTVAVCTLNDRELNDWNHKQREGILQQAGGLAHDLGGAVVLQDGAGRRLCRVIVSASGRRKRH